MAGPQWQWVHDVFICFRGKDTRKNFVSHLLYALRCRRINVFVDDELQRGESIWPALEKSIEGSRMAIVVLSRNFASSRWCLRELVTILRTRQAKGQMVRPVFIGINPSEMRAQTGFLANIMTKHEESSDSETVQQWREAIREAANLSGWSLRHGTEAELIQKIVEEVSSKLHHPYYKRVVAEASKLGPVFSFRVGDEPYLYNHGLTEKRWGSKNFTWEELTRATNNFSNDNEIGLGAYSSVYRGVLDDGKEVAIKRIKFPEEVKCQCNQAFIAELRAGYLRHRNFVRLLGFYEGENEHALVFEYMKNGSLYAHLHTLQSPALRSWNVRLRVALDVARAIEHLHEYAVPPMIHCAVRLENILLDCDWNAKLADFGLSVPISESENASLFGTNGYLDPAAFPKDYRLTTKTDVYSFGVMLLQLISGKKAAKIVEDERQMVTIDNVLVPSKDRAISCALDPNMPDLRPFKMVVVEEVARLACLCVRHDPENRPSMACVVDYLKVALARLDTSVGLEDG